MLDEAVADVAPLPDYLKEMIASAVRDEASPPELERGYMEELHKRGSIVWHSLAQQFHKQGRAAVERAATWPHGSRQQAAAQLEACNAYEFAGGEPETAAPSLVSSANLFFQMRQ